ncbi:MAG: hypothetical protein ACE15E_05625 [Acidobacteriota bacterium]
MRGHWAIETSLFQGTGRERVCNLSLNTIDLSIFAVYMIVVLALGMYAARKTVGTRRDYFLAGDRLPWWMVGGSIVASNLSSH